MQPWSYRCKALREVWKNLQKQRAAAPWTATPVFWRERMGVEPTRAGSAPPLTRF
jgi:hypothetical protein